MVGRIGFLRRKVYSRINQTGVYLPASSRHCPCCTTHIQCATYAWSLFPHFPVLRLLRRRSCGRLQVLFGKTISRSFYCLLRRIMSPYGLLFLKIRGTLIMCLLLRKTSRPLICWRSIHWPALGIFTTRVKTLGCLWFSFRSSFILTNLMEAVFRLTFLYWFSRSLRSYISGEGRTIISRFSSWLACFLRRFRPNLRWWRTLLGRPQQPDECSGEHIIRSESARQLKAELTFCILNFSQAERWNCGSVTLIINIK